MSSGVTRKLLSTLATSCCGYLFMLLSCSSEVNSLHSVIWFYILLLYALQTWHPAFWCCISAAYLLLTPVIHLSPTAAQSHCSCYGCCCWLSYITANATFCLDAALINLIYSEHVCQHCVAMIHVISCIQSCDWCLLIWHKEVIWHVRIVLISLQSFHEELWATFIRVNCELNRGLAMILRVCYNNLDRKLIM